MPGAPNPDQPDQPVITAFAKGPTDGWTIEPAPPTRKWMDETQQRFAYKCLPLVMANQVGWVIRIPAGIRAAWRGGHGMADVKIEYIAAHDSFKKQATAAFGHAIVSFVIPWIFRTPPGIGLWVRGLPNHPFPGADPLEGIVETDWATQPFTMNWRLTTENRTVTFKPNDPVCMIVPFPLDLPEALHPQLRDISEEPAVEAEFQKFIAKRRAQHERVRVQGQQGRFTYDRDAWHLDYLKGQSPGGVPADRHRTNFKLRRFDPPTTPTTPDNPAAP